MVSRRFIEFNKEFIIGEIGATTGAPVFGYVTSLFTHAAGVISGAAVVGALLGGAVFYLSLRWYHKMRARSVSRKDFVLDLIHITPMAIVFSLIVSYPTLFFLSRYLQESHSAILSVVVSQFAAFSSFLIVINIYRHFLLRITGRIL
jgi:hypothetical protein